MEYAPDPETKSNGICKRVVSPLSTHGPLLLQIPDVTINHVYGWDVVLRENSTATSNRMRPHGARPSVKANAPTIHVVFAHKPWAILYYHDGVDGTMVESSNEDIVVIRYSHLFHLTRSELKRLIAPVCDKLQMVLKVHLFEDEMLSHPQTSGASNVAPHLPRPQCNDCQIGRDNVCDGIGKQDWPFGLNLAMWIARCVRCKLHKRIGYKKTCVW